MVLIPSAANQEFPGTGNERIFKKDTKVMRLKNETMS